MPTVNEQSCPLCNNNAKYEFMAHRVSKYFSCNVCGNFEISVDAEKRLLEGIFQWCTAFSDKAKLSNEERVFAITLVSTALKQDGIASHVFNEEFVDRKN